MNGSSLDANKLLASSKEFRNAANNLPNKALYNDFRNDLNKIADKFAVSATVNLLSELGQSATNLKRVTANINRAIQEIKKVDGDLKTAAQVITATGKLAEGLFNRNSGQIGGGIDDLLGITFPKL